MISIIYALDEKTGIITKQAEYTLNPKQALICFIEQMNNNYNTFDYPKDIKGIRESKTVKDHFYYDDFKNNRVLASYPYN